MEPISNLLRNPESSKWGWTQDTGQSRIPQTKTIILWIPAYAAFRSGEAYSPTDGCERIRDRWNPYQYDCFGVLRPVSLYSRKCTPQEQNYGRELLAIVEPFKH